MRGFAVAMMVLFIGVGHASAQSADELIDEGLRLREAGNDEAAVERFRQALVLSPTPRAAAQLGLVLQALGRWVPAEEVLSDAIEHEDDPWIAPRLGALRQAYGVILEHVGFLRLVGGVEGATVTIDGQPADPLPWESPVTLNAGRHWVEVSAAGYYPIQRRVSIDAGATSRESLLLNPRSDDVEGLPTSSAEDPDTLPPIESTEPPSDSPEPDAAEHDRDGLHPAIAIAGGVVTAALLATTIWSGLQARATAEEFDQAIDDNDADSAMMLLTKGEDEETRSNILGVVTGVAGAATVLLVIFTLRGGDDDEVRAAPTVGRGTFGAVVTGTF